MGRKYEVGDVVRIIKIEDWLLKDLLPDEQAGIRGCVGREMRVAEVDRWGGIWVGIGKTTEDAEGATYSGQSFIVDPGWIELVPDVKDSNGPASK